MAILLPSDQLVAIDQIHFVDSFVLTSCVQILLIFEHQQWNCMFMVIYFLQLFGLLDIPNDSIAIPTATYQNGLIYESKTIDDIWMSLEYVCRVAFHIQYVDIGVFDSYSQLSVVCVQLDTIDRFFPYSIDCSLFDILAILIRIYFDFLVQWTRNQDVLVDIYTPDVWWMGDERLLQLVNRMFLFHLYIIYSDQSTTNHHNIVYTRALQ